MTDFRALCAELHAAFNTYAVDMKHHDLLERARAALTEPKPPSLKELALKALLHLDHGQHNERCLLIRQALEALDD